MAIKVSRETEQRLVKSIKRYVREQTGEEIGDLKAGLYLDFCLREVGPSIYNQAVADVQGLMSGKVVDLDGECHEPEFAYWKKERGE
jgi:uncharacterized protein (DUF2164 family)